MDEESYNCREKQYLAKSNHFLKLPSCFLGDIKIHLRASSSPGLVPDLKGAVRVFETTCKTFGEMQQVSWLLAFPQMCNSWKAVEICCTAEV